MEQINLNDVEDLDINEKQEEKKKLKHSDFTLSNPLKAELINYSIKNDELEFEIQIAYKAEKWKLYKKLPDIIDLIRNLRNENFTFLNEAYFLKELDYFDIDLSDSGLIKVISNNISSLLNYLNYRYDVLLSSHTNEFFKLKNLNFNDELTKILKGENLEQIYTFQIDNSDMTLSDFSYDSSIGLLVLGLEDVSILSTIGRFWSLIDYEILGSVLLYQRVYDQNNKPYFRKIIIKSFDARVTKIFISKEQNKIYVGLDNGTIQVFLINMIEKKSRKVQNENENLNTSNFSDEETHIKNENNKLFEIQNNSNAKPTCDNNQSNIDSSIIVINEGVIFKPLTERITGLTIHNNFLFISSKDNKLVILDVTNNKPELRFNGSLKKRIEGKGYIKEIFIDKKTCNLFIITITDKVLIYKINVLNKLKEDSSLQDVKIEFLNEINTIDNIRDYFLGNFNLFVATENKIQVCDLKKIKEISNSSLSSGEESNIIPFDGSLDEGISISSKYIKFDYSQGNYITSLSYFCDMKLIILGSSNGNLVGVSSKSLEIIFSKKISDSALTKMILLEENYVVIISDEKGNIFFYQFGS